MRGTAAISVAAAVAAALSGAGMAAASVLPSNGGEPALAQSSMSLRTSTSAPRTRDVMFVGNNWDGTATVVDAHTHRRVRKIDVIPDKDKRMADIRSHPDRLAFYLAIRQQVGEGHDQDVDDMFSTKDGRLVAVSRPSFADVVGIDLASGRIAWRFPMEGYRSDHMAVSPDGNRLLVSDSTANKVHELDIDSGKELRSFTSGDTPHESNSTRDGKRIFPREHRPGLHADRPDGARAGVRRGQGRACLPARAEPGLQDPEAMGHGQ